MAAAPGTSKYLAPQNLLLLMLSFLRRLKLSYVVYNVFQHRQ